jgi:hypothetical protein
MYDGQTRRAEFEKLKKWGVKGVKIDFWHSDKQNIIALYHDVLKDAAEHHILVNFHGCTIPRGWSRTYPNLVSTEAVSGEENYLFNPTYTIEAPIQNSILPFTRNVIGPMDYTPVVFTNLKYRHVTSFAHELALSVIFSSGIIHFGDNPKSYASLPAYVIDFLKRVPASFDETHFISGYPGKDIVIASRKNNEWFIAGINSEKDPKEISIELPFISNGQFDMDLITDGIDITKFSNQQRNFKAGDKFNVKMLGNGGFVATLKSK